MTQPVEAAPPSPAIARRHLETPSPLAAGQFRVVSYNILADVYASTEYAARVLYPYCKREALDGEYRQARIVRELLGYHADVVCLQEVGARMYAEFLQPCLAQAGYEGRLQLKVGTVSCPEELCGFMLSFIGNKKHFILFLLQEWDKCGCCELLKVDNEECWPCP